ncbi:MULTISPECIES: hypothetical protein [Bacteroidales]|uniref:hypothetical protein n=1 Tax=Bacteroidales TaxID=171549 RepID=UPI002570CCED|nr:MULTISPECIES: hypothetical protein [Bacteroidales]
MMKKVVMMAAVFMLIWGCNKQEIGYLDTSNAEYIPDSAVFKAVLDPNNRQDAQKIKFEIPFQTPGLQKVTGSPVVQYSIYRVDCNNGADSSVSQFRIRGKGIIELPYNHTVPVGRYVFSIQVSNEGHVHVLDSVLTVILQ